MVPRILKLTAKRTGSRRIGKRRCKLALDQKQPVAARSGGHQRENDRKPRGDALLLGGKTGTILRREVWGVKLDVIKKVLDTAQLFEDVHG